jgi:translation initiation factor eIF-2B subunit epsilon
MADTGARDLLAVVVVDSRRDKKLFPLVEVGKPACLLPLCSVSLLELVIRQLELGEVTDILVSTISDDPGYTEEISDFVDKARAQEYRKARIRLLSGGSRGYSSVGEILRELDSREELRPEKEFILVDALSVCKANWRVIVSEHKLRHEADATWTATSLFFKVAAEAFTQEDKSDILVGIDPESSQLVLYVPYSAKNAFFDMKKHIWSERQNVRLIAGICDCFCDVLSPEVLIEFRENFDYEDLRDYLRNKIESDLMEVSGNRVFFLELSNRGEYCRSVHSISSYFQIVKDFVHGWLGPLEAMKEIRQSESSLRDANAQHGERKLPARASGISILPRSENSVVASSSTIFSDSRITNCVISPGVHVAEQCSIENSILLDGCVIEKGCIVKDAILCRNSRVMRGAQIDSGCVIGPDVTVSEGAHIPEGNVVFKTFPRTGDARSETETSESVDTPSREASQDEDIFGGLDENACNVTKYSQPKLSEANPEKIAKPVDVQWQSLPYRCERRFSCVSHNPFGYIRCSQDDGVESIASSSMESDTESAASISEGEDRFRANQEISQTCATSPFKQELLETFLRAIRNDNSIDDTAVELSSLRLAYDRAPEDIVGNLVVTLISEYQHTGETTSVDTIHLLRRSLLRWRNLIQRFSATEFAKVHMLDQCAVYCVQRMLPQKFFSYLVQLLYETELIEEDILFKWVQTGAEEIGAREKIPAATVEVLLKELRPFLDWLREAEEEE